MVVAGIHHGESLGSVAYRGAHLRTDGGSGADSIATAPADAKTAINDAPSRTGLRDCAPSRPGRGRTEIRRLRSRRVSLLEKSSDAG